MEKKMIFVVDDDPVIRESLRRFLSKKHEFEVKVFENGFEVLLSCIYLVPDLIISDIRMPKLDGITLLKGLRNNESTKDIPVIFISAYPDDPILEQAKELGAIYFLAKPFKYEYLDEVLNRLMPHLLQMEPQEEEADDNIHIENEGRQSGAYLIVKRGDE